MSDDTPDTNFKVIDTRSPETRARVAGGHIGDVNEMVEEALKPCPFCGGKAVVTATYVQCTRCGGKGRSEWIDTDAIAAWNRRAPEPMTSVVRWTRYTGEPETLPDVNRWFIHSGIPMMAHTGQVLVDNIPVGNFWAYLPQPPEGAE